MLNIACAELCYYKLMDCPSVPVLCVKGPHDINIYMFTILTGDRQLENSSKQ